MRPEAVVAVSVQGADLGDTTTVDVTLAETSTNLKSLEAQLREQQAGEAKHRGRPHRREFLQYLIADKGYHSASVCERLKLQAIQPVISEPKGGRRKWKGKPGQQAAFYANRNNIRSDAGKGWMRKRGELLERAFTHDLDEGGMRRVWLKGHANIAKRLLGHVAGFNLGLLMRKLIGAGTPRAWAERAARAYAAIVARYFTHLRHLMPILRRLLRDHGFLLDDVSVHTESVELSLEA